jgi:hypothetical protein
VVVAAVEADIPAAAAERPIPLELLMIEPSRSGRTRLAGRWHDIAANPKG